MPNITANWERIGITHSISRQLLKMGFRKPKPIQHKAIPHALKFFDIFGISPAGSGKTLAYLLPIVQRVRLSKKSALILCPTRELAKQNLQVIRKFSATEKLTCHLLTGGNTRQVRLPGGHTKALYFGTPGRVLETAQKYPVQFSHIEIAVLDEFDKLLQMGFEEQINAIVRYLPQHTQRLYFSATEPDVLPNSKGRRMKTIKILPKNHGSHRIELLYYLKTAKAKNNLLLTELSSSTGQTIIFTKNWKKAAHLNGFLKLHQWDAALFHGKLDQADRFEVLREFMEGKKQLMIATDLAGRGLDTLNVDVVINFSLPQNAKDYTHRLGRTGRLGRHGKCISFASPEDFLEHKALESGLDYKIPTHPTYCHRDKWLLSAKAKHKTKVEREKRIEAIKTDQNKD